MNMKIIFKYSVILLSMVLLCQIALANCDKKIITPFIGDNLLERVIKWDFGVTSHGVARQIEMCRYNIINGIGLYHMYTLLEGGVVTYCGITDREPEIRAREHVYSGKSFDQITAIGVFVDEDTAREKEVQCVCEYHPRDNERPTCPASKRIMVGGSAYYLE